MRAAQEVGKNEEMEGSARGWCSCCMWSTSLSAITPVVAGWTGLRGHGACEGMEMGGAVVE